MSSETMLVPLPERDDTLILAGDLPKYIGIARQTLARWRHEGSGPPHVKLGGRIAYRSGDVRMWLQTRTRKNTSA